MSLVLQLKLAVYTLIRLHLLYRWRWDRKPTNVPEIKVRTWCYVLPLYSSADATAGEWHWILGRTMPHDDCIYIYKIISPPLINSTRRPSPRTGKLPIAYSTLVWYSKHVHFLMQAHYKRPKDYVLRCLTWTDGLVPLLISRTLAHLN